MEPQKRIKDLIEDRDTTQKKLAEKLGITESTMSGYLTGKVRLPAWLVQECALYFQVTADYLLGLSDESRRPLELSQTERDLVQNFRTLSRNQKELILRNVAIMREQNET